MKKLLCLLLGLGLVALAPTFAQQPEKTKPAAPHPALLTLFDLDFPGGTPGQFAAAIQKAMGRPLNVIISDEFANWKLPPMKMSHVDVVQVFRTLELASQHQEVIPISNGAYQQVSTMYGFRSVENNPSDDTVWAFYVNGPARTPKVSKFYLLKPYLENGLTVEDVTTAIQTAWKMRGDLTPPALSFHKETQLLIAVGDYGGLDVIDQVLQALKGAVAKPKPSADVKTKP